MSTQTDQNVRVEVEPPRVENGKTLLIAGLRGPLETSASIPALWQRLMAHKIPNQVGRVAYGVCFNCRDGVDNSEYLAGIEVSNFSGLPAELSHLSIPPRK